MKPLINQSYWNPDGTPTQLAYELFEELAQLDAKIAALGAITKPSGGATVDTEARTAIDALIDAANT